MTNLPDIAKSPVLQAAINGLDVTLHAELERYRHWCEQRKALAPLSSPPKARAIAERPEAEPLISQTDISSESIYFDDSPDFALSENGTSANYQDIDLSSEIVEYVPSPTEHPTEHPKDLELSLEEFPEADLQEWVEGYQQQVQTPIALTDEEIQQGTKTQLEVSEEPSDEDFTIGTAGIVSIVLIAFSIVAIALLLFDPFGLLRLKRNENNPSPAPQSRIIQGS